MSNLYNRDILPSSSVKMGADKNKKIRHNRSMAVNTSIEALSVEEAMKILGISRSLIYKLFNTKQLSSFHIGTRRFTTRMAIRDYIDTCEENEANYDI